MSVFLTITIFLPIIICGEYQEQQLISELNKFFNFDHNILFLDTTVDINRFIYTKVRRKFTPTSLYTFEIVDGNITGMVNLTKINSKNTFLIVSPNGSNYERNLNLLTKIKKIQRLQLKMKIGLFFQEIVSSEDLRKIFEWSWKHRIINIFAATYVDSEADQRTISDGLLNIFTFNPFGTLTVVNFTGSKTYASLFLRQNCNFHQHPLRVIRRRWDYFWPTVFRVMNASYTEVSYNATTFSDVFENQFDVVSGVTISIDLRNPIAIVKYNTLVIVVPEALPYDEFAAYLHAILKDSFFGYSVTIIVGVMLILIVVRYITQKRILLLQSGGDVLNLLMNDNASIKYQQLHRSELFLIVPLTFVGLVIVNGILSNLQSYLTRPILQPQVHTVEDIYNSLSTIVAQSEYQKSMVADTLTNLFKRDDWEDKIRIDGDVINQAETYNRSLTFLALTETANQLLRVQKQLGIKGYHITDTYIRQYFNTYIVHDAFPFTERLNELIHWLQSAGLFNEWSRRESRANDKKFLQLKREQLNISNDDKRTDAVDKIENVPIPMFVVYGWIASIIVLVMEIIWKNFNAFRTAAI